ncbi:MAG: DnaD domain protein [Dehalococcoidia bacterium]|jgi:DnaD/phage-associated family protein
MKKFEGFPARMDFTSIPNVFFSRVMPQIDDIAELKTTLHVISVLYRKKGSPRFVGCGELAADESLMNSLKGNEGPPEEVLRRALESAVERGTLLHIPVHKDDVPEDIYLLNTQSNRELSEKIESGEIALPGMQAAGRKYPQSEEMPDIFTLYEENIGIITPMIADELREAEKLYPEEWINDSIKQAVLNNKRNIKYILKILENWVAEGKSDGAYQRHSKKTDPDKYIKGKYGHMVRR